MDIYQFASDSPVAKIEFTQDAKKVWLAQIFPQPGASADQLSSLTTLLNQRQDGIIAVPESHKGVHTLYASGFADPHLLLTQMAQTGHAKGTAKKETLSKEAEAYSAKIREASLKLAGIFYLISDAALAASGIMSKRYKETIAGLKYSVGGVMLARYGRKDAHTHLQDLSLQLGDFFKREGIEIPKDGPIAGANRERHAGFIEGMERFAYTYPSQIFNTLVASCGYNIIQSGLNHKKPWDTTAGALVMGGALAGLLIPEKTGGQSAAEEKPKRKASGPIGRFIDWMKEKPLRIPGMLWFGNNIAFTVSAIKERQQNPAQKSYLFKFGYAAAAVIANGLMFISSKQTANEHSDIDSESMQALMAVSANVIAQQPKAMQDHIIEQVSGYMAAQSDNTQTAKEIATAIRDQVRELANNPFLPHEPAASAQLQKPYSLQHTAKSDWQNSISAPEIISISH